MMEAQLIHSVGIDIGTSTTQCVFSSMRLENQAPAFAIPRITLADRRVLYRAPLYLTPLSSPDTIDVEAVRALIASDYRAAGILPEQIDTGAVIITGETARKHNARAVAEALAEFAGDFVVATAGPALESVMAGKGSGAAALSNTLGKRVLNLDIGGGTTNICLLARGEPVETGCVDIGGRLLRRDPRDQVVLSHTRPMQTIAESLGITVCDGAPLLQADMERIVQRMVEVLEEAAGLSPRTPLYASLVVEHGLPAGTQADVFTFSGGVAGCVYGDADNPLFADDLGVLLGNRLQSSRFFTQGRVLRPSETQHATVIGAGVYSVTVTGSTIAYEGVSLPLRGLPVGKVPLKRPEDIPALSEHVARQVQMLGEPFALCFEGWKSPSYREIENIAAVLHEALPLTTGCPVIVIAQDMAKALGQAVQRLRGPYSSLLCVDGVALSYGDQIDIGMPLANGRVLPIVVKTLAFSS